MAEEKLPEHLNEVVECLKPRSVYLLEKDGDVLIDDNGAMPVDTPVVNFYQQTESIVNIYNKLK